MSTHYYSFYIHWNHQNYCYFQTWHFQNKMYDMSLSKNWNILHHSPLYTYADSYLRMTAYNIHHMYYCMYTCSLYSSPYHNSPCTLNNNTQSSHCIHLVTFPLPLLSQQDLPMQWLQRLAAPSLPHS